MNLNRPAGLVPKMLNHLAYVTHDVAATADFYTRVLGMELASTIFDDHVPSTGENFPYFHIFFRMGDGSTIAFFECTDLPPAAKSTHPAYDTFNHCALWVENQAEVRRWQANASLQWSESDIALVATYLNDTVYRYPDAADRLSLR